MATKKTFTKDATVGSEIETSCSKCGEGTAHTVKASMKEEGQDYYGEDWMYGWINELEIIQCAGCKMLSFRKSHSNSEDSDEDGTIVTVELFPSPVKGRGPINDHTLLPKALQRIYLETLKALNSEQPVLAGIGIRAAVENICKEQNASGNDLEKKIDDLVTKHVLTQAGAAILQKLRVMGNKAAHEVEPHDVLQLGFAFDVIDNLVSAVYILPHHAKAQFK